MVEEYLFDRDWGEMGYRGKLLNMQRSAYIGEGVGYFWALSAGIA